MTRNAVLVGTQKKAVTSLTVTGAFMIKMTDFKEEQPTLLGMKADDEIKPKFMAYFN